MALYLGEAVRIRASATDPESGAALDPPPTSAAVDFWAPGVDRKEAEPTIPGVAMTYRTEQNDFVLFQATAGPSWTVGKWTYRVTVQGEAFSNWEYGTFALKA